MLSIERKEKIHDFIEKKGVATIAELLEKFNVSEITIRRDLKTLSDSHLVERTYGGVRSLKGQAAMSSFYDDLKYYVTEKKKIAQSAAELVQNNETIILDGGSTTYYIAENLREKNIHVVTNSLPVIQLLTNYPNIEVIATGGVLFPKAGIFLGLPARKMLEQTKVDKAFIGVAGIDDEGISNSNLLLVETEREMINSAKEVIVVADSNKFGKNAMGFLVGFSEVDTIITDSGVLNKQIDIKDKVKDFIIV